ncbi:hypothetical protein JW960_02470 [candidate division KSB1 bacterium]|nr:hypothetical protein [candidate division KSB1 bacterium]
MLGYSGQLFNLFFKLTGHSCFGIKNPRAIKDFLRYAYENWQVPAPTYVLLFGDASYDYLDYLATGRRDDVPTHLFESSY